MHLPTLVMGFCVFETIEVFSEYSLAPSAPKLDEFFAKGGIRDHQSITFW
jgi:hypothetical protein